MVKKVITGVVAIIGLFFGYLTFNWFNPDEIFKTEGPPITMEQILADPPVPSIRNYYGKTAGEDIPRLSGGKEFDKMQHTQDGQAATEPTQYATAVPVKIVATGVYDLKPWVYPYYSKGAKKYRRKPYATRTPIMIPGSYQEFYLIQLPDSSYILAQFSESYRRAINKGKETTLPIGIKKRVGLASSLLQNICEQYGASDEYVLYTVDDDWYNHYDFIMVLIKFGAAAIVCIATGTALLIVEEKVFKKRR